MWFIIEISSRYNTVGNTMCLGTWISVKYYDIPSIVFSSVIDSYIVYLMGMELRNIGSAKANNMLYNMMINIYTL